MTILEHLRQLNNRKLVRSTFQANGAGAVGIVLLGLTLLLLTAHLAAIWPFVGVVLSWLWLMLPGFALSYLLVPSLSWIERVPLSFVLGIGLATPYTVLAILLRLSLNSLLALSLLTLILSAALYSLQQRSSPDHVAEEKEIVQHTRPSVAMLPLLALLSLLVGVLVYLSVQWPPAGDDLAGLAYFAEIVRLDRITGAEPFHGTGTPVTPRNELIVWAYQNILLIKITGLSPVDYFVNSRPFFIILAFLSLFTLLHQALKQWRLTLFVLNLWAIYLLSTLKVDMSGNELITRIAQDKFVGWFVFVPVTLAPLLWYMQGNRLRHLLIFAAGAFAAALLHPITLTQVLILASGFGLVYLLTERNRQALRRLLPVMGILAFCLAIPVVQYLRYQDRMPVEAAGLGSAIELGRLTMAIGRYRLWLVGANSYILHPDFALRPLVIAGVLLSPLLLWLEHRHNAARLLAGALLLLPVLLYIPPLAKIVGTFLTPYLLWRLAWPLALLSVSVLGWLVWRTLSAAEQALLSRSGPQAATGFQTAGVLAILTLALAAAAPDIQAGYTGYKERVLAEEFSICAVADAAIEQLDNLSQREPLTVLASRQLNYCIPGLAPLANVIEFRGYGTVNRLPEADVADSLKRVEQAWHFSGAQRVDTLILTTIRQRNVDYVMISNDNLDLALQFRHLPALFAPVYDDARFSIYEVKNPLVASPIVEGNQALQEWRWKEAEAQFRQIRDDDPQALIAYVGLAQALQGQGKFDGALHAYHLAVELALSEPALHAQLGSIYLATNDAERAAEAYRRAIELAPDVASLQLAMANVERIRGNAEAAQRHFARAASLQTTTGSAAYYALLARLQHASGWPEAAVESYRMAIALEPTVDRYVNLARALADIGLTTQAIAAYDEGSEFDPWHYLPHMSLGKLYEEQGELEAAIGEYEHAARLNPAGVSSYVLLSLALREQAGTEVALSRMEQLAALHPALPGPHRALATLHTAEDNLDRAMAELDRAEVLQPRNASLASARGFLYLADDDAAHAHEAFRKALSLNPRTISARIGLGIVAFEISDYSGSSAQLREIARLKPALTWPHTTLAANFARQGQWGSAETELKWALYLAPDNRETLLALGDLYRKRLRWPEAITHLTAVLESVPTQVEALVGLAQVQQQMGQFDAAEQFYERAIVTAPDDARAYVRLAQMYRLLGRSAEALAVEEKALASVGQLKYLLLSLAASYRAQDRLEDAAALYAQVVESNPEAISAYVALAHLEAEEEDWETATSLYDALLESNPGNSQAYLATARYYQYRGQIMETEEAIRQSLQLTGASAENYRVLSRVLEQQGEWEEAETVLEQAVTRFPAEAQAHLNLATSLAQHGNVEAAAPHFERAIDLDLTLAPAYVGRWEAAYYQGDIQAADGYVATALERNPGSAPLFLAAGAFYRMKGELQQAEAFVRHSLTLAGVSSENYLALSDLQQRQSNWQDAHQTLQEAVTRFPDDPGAYYNLARYEMQRGHLDDAESHFASAIRHDSALVDAYAGLVEIARYRGDETAADELLSAAIAQNPGSAAPLLLLARVQQLRGDVPAAESTLQQALALAPADATAHVQLGDFYYQENRLADALETWQAALSLPLVGEELYIRLGDLYLALGQAESAQAWYEKAVQVDTYSASPHLALARLYSSLGRLDDAASALHEARRREPDRAEVYLSLAQLSQTRGDAATALLLFERALAVQPAWSETYIAVAEFHTGAGEEAQALEILRRGITVMPMSGELYQALGRHYQAQGYPTAAELALKMAVERSADRVQALRARAEFYEWSGAWSQADADYQELLRRYPSSLAAGLQAADFYRQRARYDEALAILQTLSALPHGEARVALATGDTLVLLGHWSAAEDAYKTAIAMDGELTAAYAGLARIDTLQGRPEEALEHLLEAVSASPQEAQALINLGDGYRNRLVVEEARAAYEAALELEAEHETALQRLVLLSHEQHELLSLLEQTAAQTPTAQRAVTLASIYLEQGLWEQAGVWSQRAVELSPSDEHSWFVLGEYYRSIQARDDALNAFTEARRRHPYSAQILLAIGAVQEELGMGADAQMTYLQLIQAQPTGVEAYIALAALAYNNDQPDLARDTLTTAIETVPGDARPYHALGAMLAAMDEPQAALSIFDSGLNVAPGDADLYTASGDVLSRSIPPALAALERAQTSVAATGARVAALEERYTAAHSRPTQPALALKLAEAHRLHAIAEGQLSLATAQMEAITPDYHEAISAYQQALALNPAHEGALLGMGHLTASWHSVEEALPYYLQATTAHPNSARALVALARGYLETGHMENAIPLFERALRFEPGNVIAHTGLADAYRYTEQSNVLWAARIITHAHFGLNDRFATARVGTPPAAVSAPPPGRFRQPR